MNSRFFLTLFVLIVSASTGYAQDAKKTADDFAAKWVAAYDAGDAAASDYQPDGRVYPGHSTGAPFEWRDDAYCMRRCRCVDMNKARNRIFDH